MAETRNDTYSTTLIRVRKFELVYSFYAVRAHIAV